MNIDQAQRLFETLGNSLIGITGLDRLDYLTRIDTGRVPSLTKVPMTTVTAEVTLMLAQWLGGTSGDRGNAMAIA